MFDVGLEAVFLVGLVLNDAHCAVGIVQCVSAFNVVALLLLPGTLVVAGLVVFYSIFVGVGCVLT